ncbi:MAG: hypothetical protein ACE14M_01175 [Terriglobales bacterium]
MFTQVLQATVKRNRILEFKHGITQHALPAIRTQPGFVDAVELYSSNKFMCITFWRTQQDTDRFVHQLLPRILARTEPLLADLARCEVFKIASDTIHQAQELGERKVEVAARPIAAAA